MANRVLILCTWLVVLASRTSSGGDPARGYELLVTKPYLTVDFDDPTFDDVWQVWPESLRTRAEKLSPVERREMAFSRYGLTSRPEETVNSAGLPLPLQYVVNNNGKWTMNCFSCHGGTVLGQVVPGAPNSRYDLQTLSEEMRALKQLQEKPLTRMEVATGLLPLGTSVGTTNAAIFGVMLLSQRDAELNHRPSLSIPPLVHHDLDPPAWWLYKRKAYIYTDGYAERSHRALMQFLLVRANGPDKFRDWEPDYQDISAYLESLEAPRYPFPIDEALAQRGALVFSRHCAECHGEKGGVESYPDRIVSIDILGTDPARLQAIPPDGRAAYGKSWFGSFGEDETRQNPDGYQAPPLDGVWASAPYFHNGSVPTLWHVLHPESRPAVWRRTSEDGYDQGRGGLVIEELATVPNDVSDPHERRSYFDTSRYGKSAGGHLFPNQLTEEEKREVLEYLKSL